MISRMFEYCRKGLAFNVLDARNKMIESCSDLQSFHPDEIVSFCGELTENCKFRDDYQDNDFSMYLYRDVIVES